MDPALGQLPVSPVHRRNIHKHTIRSHWKYRAEIGLERMGRGRKSEEEMRRGRELA